MAKKAVLVCNGSVNTKYLFSQIGKTDFLIAVDGGANKLVKTSHSLDLIIGDMDSITKSTLKKFRNVKMLKFPREKDFVDLELALNYCVENKFREIVVLGAVGTRADMNLTNVFLLSQLPKNVNAKIVHENQEIFLVPKKLSIEGVPGEKISFLPVKGDVTGLTLEGFRYELENFDLRFGIGKGLSNEFKSKKGRVSFQEGILLCVHFRKWV